MLKYCDKNASKIWRIINNITIWKKKTILFINENCCTKQIKILIKLNIILRILGNRPVKKSDTLNSANKKKSK